MNAKRRLVILVTFVAGLYYLLEFLLPPTVGGALDSAGASAACVLPGSTRLLYTATREGQPPVIAEWANGRRRAVLTPSIFRRDDYRGALNPWVAGDRLYYIGLGYDDKTPRVCMARRSGNRWAPLRRALLDRGQPGEWDSSGVTWLSLLPPADGRPQWRLWYVGRQGNVGRVGLAVSQDGVRWTKRGMVLAPPNGGSIESVHVERDPARGTLEATLVCAPEAGSLRSLFAATLDPTGERLLGRLRNLSAGEPSRPVRIPPGLSLVDARRSGGVLWVTLESPDHRTAVHRSVAGPEPARIDADPTIAPGPRPHSTYLSEARTAIDDLMVVIGSFAVGLGLISLVQVHGRKILRKHRQWPESATFFLAAIAMSAATLWDRTHAAEGDAGKRAYALLFYGLFQPLGSAMFSLLAAYLVSAAYRAFRIRSFESTLMAASAVLIMLGQVPIGNWLTHGLPHGMQIPTIMTWVLFVTNNAVVRAVNFGIFVGALATAVRVWLSMDRAAMRFD